MPEIYLDYIILNLFYCWLNNIWVRVMMLSATFSYIVAVSFIAGGNRCTRRNPQKMYFGVRLIISWRWVWNVCPHWATCILVHCCIRFWRYQRGNQNPCIEEEQTAQWSKGKSTKGQTTIYKNSGTARGPSHQHVSSHLRSYQAISKKQARNMC
jgi:hypothetical protein